MDNRIAFISDIHGHYPALQAALRDIEQRGIHSIICLGDIVGYFSMINEVIDLLRMKNIPTILGNHDFALAFADGLIERSRTCTKILKAQLDFIRADNLTYIQRLPREIVIRSGPFSLYCVHGGLQDPLDEYVFDIDESYFRIHHFRHDCLVTGHTHRRVNNRIGKFWHLNPGSVGQPRGEHTKSSYLIFDGEDTQHIEFEYEPCDGLAYMG